MTANTNSSSLPGTESNKRHNKCDSGGESSDKNHSDQEINQTGSPTGLAQNSSKNDSGISAKNLGIVDSSEAVEINNLGAVENSESNLGIESQLENIDKLGVIDGRGVASTDKPDIKNDLMELTKIDRLDEMMDKNGSLEIGGQKRNICKHPLFPLMAAIYKKCHLATTGKLDDIKDGTSSVLSERTEFFEKLAQVKYDPNNPLDRLMLLAIQVLWHHLMELQKVYSLCTSFCDRYIQCLKGKMPVDVASDESQMSPSRMLQNLHAAAAAHHHHHQLNGHPPPQFMNLPGLNGMQPPNHMQMAGLPQMGQATNYPPPPNPMMGIPQNQNGSQNLGIHGQGVQNQGVQNQDPHGQNLQNSGSHNQVLGNQNMNQGMNQGVNNPGMNTQVPQNQGVHSHANQNGSLNSQNLQNGHIQPLQNQPQNLQANQNPHNTQNPQNPQIPVTSVQSQLQNLQNLPQQSFFENSSETQNHFNFNDKSPTNGNLGNQLSGPDDDELSGDQSLHGNNKKRGSFSKSATQIMRNWLYSNLSHPYPSEEQKKALSNQTGLTILQVNNWFINARRRIVQPLIDQSNRSCRIGAAAAIAASSLTGMNNGMMGVNGMSNAMGSAAMSAGAMGAAMSASGSMGGLGMNNVTMGVAGIGAAGAIGNAMGNAMGAGGINPMSAGLSSGGLNPVSSLLGGNGGLGGGLVSQNNPLNAAVQAATALAAAQNGGNPNSQNQMFPGISQAPNLNLASQLAAQQQVAQNVNNFQWSLAMLAAQQAQQQQVNQFQSTPGFQFQNQSENSGMFNNGNNQGSNNNGPFPGRDNNIWEQ